MTPEDGTPRQVGRYAVYDVLAAGGMATVHLGRLLGPVGFSRTVAIKRLHAQFASDPEFVPGFLDEARLAARIRHPNVVPTLDVVATDGQLLLVMEYVQGESLSRLLKASAAKKTTVPIAVASGILVGALEGLHAAHEAKNEKGEPLGIVHRDVSPQNVLVGVDGVARVLDFGVAKAAGRLQTTRSGQLKGKVAYMSPEQLRSEPVDRRTDVFAASIVLWETLASRRLFTGESEGAVLTALLMGPIAPPSSVAKDVPPAVDAIVLKGLERDPTKRWASAREMAKALEEAVPPATPRQIAEWVDSLAHEALEQRAARVAEIESSSSAQDAGAGEMLAQLRATSSGSVAAAAISTAEMATISHSAISVSSALRAKPRRRWPLPVAGALVAVAAVAMFAAFASRAPKASTTASVTPPPAPLASSPAAAVESAQPSASAIASASAAPIPTHAAARPRKPTVDCSTPYTRDELGRKIYKPECLE